jgi:hypothetical protein
MGAAAEDSGVLGPQQQAQWQQQQQFRGVDSMPAGSSVVGCTRNCGVHQVAIVPPNTTAMPHHPDFS